MKVRFWGVRGSHPVPGPQTNRYGGNTLCVQFSPDDDTVIIADAGTGIRPLGKALQKGAFGRGEGSCHLLISHTHWDHIQGLPFFAPLYVAGNHIKIYARQREVNLRTIFRSQTEDPYFPVGLDEVAAKISYVEILEGTQFMVGEVRVSCARLNHPNIAIGYRLDADGVSAAYISDTAPFDRVFFRDDYMSERPNLPLPEEEKRQLERMHRGVVELCRGCDLVIYDTMFRPEDYDARPHWGHGTIDHAMELVTEAGAKTLALFHYAPDMSDDELDTTLHEARSRFAIPIVAAAEGLEVRLGKGEEAPMHEGSPAGGGGP